MHIIATILISVLFVLPNTGLALEAYPEFQSLTEEEESRFDRPHLLGGEYQSYLLAYRKPFIWEYYWLSSKNAFDTSVGSISPVEFLMDQRLKLQGNLSSLLEFRFTYFDEREHENIATHAIPEFIFWAIKDKLGISLYGEPSYYKREDDIALSAIFKPTTTHEIRLFYTWVDVTRQKRSDRSDTFIDDLPYSMGLVGRYWSEDLVKPDFFEYAFRYETKTRWRFPDPTDNYDYLYDRMLALFWVNHGITDSLRINFHTQYDHKFEERSPLGAGTKESWNRDRFQTSLALDISNFIYHDWKLSPGFEYAYRFWVTNRDGLTYNNYMPYVSLNMPGFAQKLFQDRWGFSVSTTIHHKTGGTIIGHPHDKDAVNERFDLSYFIVFHERGELRLVASFDIDQFGSRQTWEGGNAQFRFALP